ncbi:MAG: NFACT family protein [Defluviitaleaceae bacterium]|nr:NFACT family protein [Defluviitaleaceae bacterium]
MIDGVVLSNLVRDMQILVGGRIDKIHQPNKEEIVLNIRAGGKNHKLFISANAKVSRVVFTNEKFENPEHPPMFCMLLRKHINGRIISITQPNFERLVEIEIESMTELMEITQKKLIIEIMGKHSNIILIRGDGTIIDSIKHINHLISSVREILPNKVYNFPPNQNKINFLEFSYENFQNIFENRNKEISELIYKSYTGISPSMSNIICIKSKIEPNQLIFNEVEKNNLFNSLLELKHDIQNNNFTPFVVMKNNGKETFIAVHTVYKWAYNGFNIKEFDNISSAIEYFCKNKEQNYRTTQKISDLKKIVNQNISRATKKHEIFLKNLKEIENRDLLKIYGEIILSNLYNIKSGQKILKTQNFYDENNSEINIELNENLTPVENANIYFKNYNKQKRSYVKIIEQMKENELQKNYLESIYNSLLRELTETEIEEIREELILEKILKKKKTKKRKNIVSTPMKFISSDGFEIFIGKNNKQNDELTINASNFDMWLHTKDTAGSHVIIKSNNKNIPNTTIEEAASLAAFYSKAQNSDNVAVDYTFKKFVKKPNGAKPGMVIYTNNKTTFVSPTMSI